MKYGSYALKWLLLTGLVFSLLVGSIAKAELPQPKRVIADTSQHCGHMGGDVIKKHAKMVVYLREARHWYHSKPMKSEKMSERARVYRVKRDRALALYTRMNCGTVVLFSHK